MVGVEISDELLARLERIAIEYYGRMAEELVEAILEYFVTALEEGEYVDLPIGR
jgi:nucleoid DNA-binding protein